jgi:riboflavin kinase/FMN adenylyltransferase
MKLSLGLQSIHLPKTGCVATIGNFDGVHLGHRAVIDRLAEQGRRLNLPVCVVLFEPQAREYFSPHNAPPRLMRLRDKVDRLADLPVDHVLILRFNRALASQSPHSFIQTILIDALRVRYLVVGDDFRFGKQREGNFTLLQAVGHQVGFEVTDTPSVLIDGSRVSSTLIRQALAMGDLAYAARLLGKPYEVCGRIIHGQKRGRTMGFPTANVLLQRKNTPVKGVFAVTMRSLGAPPLPGVANVGSRPTVTGNKTMLLETHLLDFSGDLYGRKVEVEFHSKLRDERRFSDLTELSAQIAQDISEARSYFAHEHTDPSFDYDRRL